MITIKAIRAKLGISQAVMAKLLGTSPHRVSEIERGAYGRKESVQMQAHLVALESAHESGEIEALIKTMKENKV